MDTRIKRIHYTLVRGFSGMVKCESSRYTLLRIEGIKMVINHNVSKDQKRSDSTFHYRAKLNVKRLMITQTRSEVHE